jgi:hypothetical protein
MYIGHVLQKPTSNHSKFQELKSHQVVFRRSPGSRSVQEEAEIQRFQNTLQKAREMGANIPEWDYHSTHYDAYWNIPAMRKFLGDSVIYANQI